MRDKINFFQFSPTTAGRIVVGAQCAEMLSAIGAFSGIIAGLSQLDPTYIYAITIPSVVGFGLSGLTKLIAKTQIDNYQPLSP